MAGGGGSEREGGGEWGRVEDSWGEDDNLAKPEKILLQTSIMILAANGQLDFCTFSDMSNKVCLLLLFAPGSVKVKCSLTKNVSFSKYYPFESTVVVIPSAGSAVLRPTLTPDGRSQQPCEVDKLVALKEAAIFFEKCKLSNILHAHFSGQ